MLAAEKKTANAPINFSDSGFADLNMLRVVALNNIHPNLRSSGAAEKVPCNIHVSLVGLNVIF